MTTDKSIPTLAVPVAPEDLTRGQYVALLHEVDEDVIYRCCDLEPRPPVRFPVLTVPMDPVMPLRIREICLPFVLARRPDRTHVVLDVRRWRFARLDQSFGQRVTKSLRPRKRNGKRRGP